jgi:hypothetical protein
LFGLLSHVDHVAPERTTSAAACLGVVQLNDMPPADDPMTDVPQPSMTRTRSASRASLSFVAVGPDRPPRRTALALLVTAGILSALVAPACGGSEKASASGANVPQSARPESIDHERCDLSGAHVEPFDTNGDGKPDIQRVYDGSKHEVCRVTDLNHDGKPDLYEYFDASSAIRRREFCYDDTGVVNAVELYQGGKLVQRQYDTTGQHKLDTWDWFDPNAPIDGKTGRPVHPIRRERDVRGVGIIDQWWTWSGDRVSIATDRNGDGKPDPESVIVLGGGEDAGGVAPTTAPAPLPAADGGASSEGGMP